MRLIDADELIKNIKNAEKFYRESKCLGSNSCPYKLACADGARAVADLIVRDAVTIEERKHGYWITVLDPSYVTIGFECSVCKEKTRRVSNYCPHCGAKMDEEEKQ